MNRCRSLDPLNLGTRGRPGANHTTHCNALIVPSGTHAPHRRSPKVHAIQCCRRSLRLSWNLSLGSRRPPGSVPWTFVPGRVVCKVALSLHPIRTYGALSVGAVTLSSLHPAVSLMRHTGKPFPQTLGSSCLHGEQRCRRCCIYPGTVLFWIRDSWIFNLGSSGNTTALVHAHVALSQCLGRRLVASPMFSLVSPTMKLRSKSFCKSGHFQGHADEKSCTRPHCCKDELMHAAFLLDTKRRAWKNRTGRSTARSHHHHQLKAKSILCFTTRR